MDIAEFRASLDGAEPPQGLSHAMQALWWDAKGDWQKAHHCAQQTEENAEGQWVHAYLHRVEGDLSNAGHWYRRAGREAASGALAAEWETIAAALLAGEKSATR